MIEVAIVDLGTGVYSERGGKWERFDDFEADLRKAGFTQFSTHSKKMGYLNVDPVLGHLYRISTRTIRKRRWVQLTEGGYSNRDADWFLRPR